MRRALKDNYILRDCVCLCVLTQRKHVALRTTSASKDQKTMTFGTYDCVRYLKHILSFIQIFVPSLKPKIPFARENDHHLLIIIFYMSKLRGNPQIIGFQLLHQNIVPESPDYFAMWL